MGKNGYNDDWQPKVEALEEQLRSHITDTYREITDLRNRNVLLKSEIESLKGQVNGGQMATSEQFRCLGSQMDRICSEVFRPTISNRIRWFISELFETLK